MRKHALLCSFILLSLCAAMACGTVDSSTYGAGSSPTPSAQGSSSATATPTSSSSSPSPTPSAAPTPANACISNFTWVLGNFASDWMHPGVDCVGCHATTSGPDLWVGGTVYAAGGQVDDCGGVSGVEVDVTDANGVLHALTSNFTGNFYLRKSDAPGFALPYTAKLKLNGVERIMSASQSNGGCNSCHTQSGTSGAPGRVIQP